MYFQHSQLPTGLSVIAMHSTQEHRFSFIGRRFGSVLPERKQPKCDTDLKPHQGPNYQTENRPSLNCPVPLHRGGNPLLLRDSNADYSRETKYNRRDEYG